MAKPIPEGYHAVTPYLICKGAAQAIEFYKKDSARREGAVPDGRARRRSATPSCSSATCHLMLADESPDGKWRSPQSVGGTPVTMMLYVKDVDTTFKDALAAGAHVVHDVKDQFYGDRSGTIPDPFGHVWTIGTHIEDVSPDEMARRMAQLPQP